MARIEGVSDRRAGWLARIAYAFTRRKLGRVPEPLRVIAHHRAVLAGTAAFESALERCRELDERLKALAGIRAATLVACPF